MQLNLKKIYIHIKTVWLDIHILISSGFFVVFFKLKH